MLLAEICNFFFVFPCRFFGVVMVMMCGRNFNNDQHHLEIEIQELGLPSYINIVCKTDAFFNE